MLILTYILVGAAAVSETKKKKFRGVNTRSAAMSPPKRAKLDADDASVDDMLKELAEGRSKVAENVSAYKFNKNRVRLLAGNEGDLLVRKLSSNQLAQFD